MPCLPRFFLGFQGRNGRTEDTKRTGSKETIRFRDFRVFRGSSLTTTEGTEKTEGTDVIRFREFRVFRGSSLTTTEETEKTEGTETIRFREFCVFRGSSLSTMERTEKTEGTEVIRFREFRVFRGSTLITIRVKQNYNSSAQSMTESKRQWCASQKSQPINRGSLQPQTLSACPIS